MRRARHASAWSAAAGTLLSVALSATAAPPATKPLARDPAAAEALFEQGRRALEKNDLVTACAKFAESQRLDPGVGTLMNWATCEERQGRIATAWQRWREALAELPADDDRLAFARQRVADLEPRLPHLSITLRSNAPAGTRVQRDDVVLGRASLGTPLPVDPGVRSITVDAPGFEPRTFRLAIAEGEKKSLEVAPGNALPASPSDSSGSNASPRRAIGWTLIGAGAAGVITGVVTGLMLDAKRDDVDANCAPEGCNREGLDAADDGKTLLVVNAVSWGAGIAALGGGAYLVLSSPRASQSTVDTAAVAPRSPSVGVSVSPSGFGFAYRSRF